MSRTKIPGPPAREGLRLGELRRGPTAGTVATPTSRASVQETVQTLARPARARMSIMLPSSVAEELRARALATQRTQADLILSALLAQHDSVAEQLQTTTAERAAVGLPPLRPPKPGGATTQLSVSITALGRDRLDADAAKLGVGRSALVLAVLTAEFAGD